MDVEEVLISDERRRLEALAQAVAYSVARGASAEVVVQTAKTFDTFLRDGE
jgi:hypothetical protein